MSQALLAALPALWEMRLLYTPASSNTAVVERGCGCPPALPPSVASFALTIFSFQEIVPIMDLAVNEEFTRMYSEEELMGARRIQVHTPKRGGKGRGQARFPRHRGGVCRHACSHWSTAILLFCLLAALSVYKGLDFCTYLPQKGTVVSSRVC